MENVTTNNTVESQQTDSEETINLIAELNSQSINKNGEWINVPNVGPCWRPANIPVAGGAPTETPEIPPSIQSLISWGNSIDIDNIPQNSVVMIKLGVNDPLRYQMMQRAIARQVLEPRIEKLKEKRVCILFMQAGDDISVMTEEEMNRAGWEKKDRNRIITL